MAAFTVTQLVVGDLFAALRATPVLFVGDSVMEQQYSVVAHQVGNFKPRKYLSCSLSVLQ